MVLWPHRGAHSGAVNTEEEDDPAWLVQMGRSSSGGLNRGTERWWTRWRDEFGNGGVRRMNSGSSSPRRRWHWADGKVEKEVH
jgi:hypothetical protein